MKFQLWLPILLIASTSAGGSEALSLRASPRSSFAPSNLQILVRLAPDDGNRSLTIEANSDDFYRMSEIPLEGGRAPRSVLVAFRALPGGSYQVTASLFGSRGERRAQVQQEIIVLSAGTDLR